MPYEAAEGFAALSDLYDAFMMASSRRATGFLSVAQQTLT